MNAIIGDNGIITRAQEAKKLSEKSSDEEAIKLMFIENVMNGDGTVSVGEELIDRTVDNGDKWNIIVEKETGNVYGTGYYYISKGTKLKNGQEATTNWLVDKNGKMKELKDDTFSKLNFASTIGVTDGLLFNMDATNIGEGEFNWGNGVTLRYFDEDTYNDYDSRKKAYSEQKIKNTVKDSDSGYDRMISEDSTQYIDKEQQSFKFSGNNYIEIKNDKDYDFSKGLEFEFGGKITSRQKNANW